MDDPRIDTWNVLHDGELTSFTLGEEGDALTMCVKIPYLRRRLKPFGDSFVLTLGDLNRLEYHKWNEIGPVVILSTNSKTMPVEVLMTKARLILDFQSIQFALDSGEKIEFDIIAKAREDYWRDRRTRPEAEATRKRNDYSTALRLIRPLAEKGDAAAQFSLGQMQANGQGVTQDYAEALKWYRMAADQGHPQAQSNLGLMYEKGRGVPQDYFQAVKWFRKAAEQGDAFAQTHVGFMYSNGRGVAQDLVQAHMFLNLATAGFGTSEAVDSRRAAFYLELVASKMTPEQIAEAKRLASEWKPNKN
jgi:hypothetical protein